MILPPNTMPIPEGAVPLTDSERQRIQRYLQTLEQLQRHSQQTRSCLDDILNTIGERAGVGSSPRLSADLSFIQGKEKSDG